MKETKKKPAQNAPLVNTVIHTYRETGKETDPMGMYTGVVRELKPLGTTCFCPDTKTPTDAILSGKTYHAKANLGATAVNDNQISYADAMPQQDADDL